MEMVDAIKPLFTAHGTAIGGRNGHTRSDDGIVNLDLSVPKEMGGPGKPNTATPEHLFAAGYAACFGGALDFIAKQHKKDASKATPPPTLKPCNDLKAKNGTLPWEKKTNLYLMPEPGNSLKDPRYHETTGY